MQYSTHLGRLEVVLDLRWQTLGGTVTAVFGMFLLMTSFTSVFFQKSNMDPAVPSSNPSLSTQKNMPLLKNLPTPTFTLTPLPPLWKVAPEPSLPDLVLLTPPEKWQPAEGEAVQEVTAKIAQKLADTIHHNPALLEITGTVTAAQAFWLVYGGPVEFHRTGQSCTESRTARGLPHMPCDQGIWGETVSANLVLVFKEATPSKLTTHPRWFVHELGHAFSYATEKQAERDVPHSLLSRNTFAGPLNAWQFSSSVEQGEVFADLFLAWVFDAWGQPANGKLFIDMFAPVWLGIAILD